MEEVLDSLPFSEEIVGALLRYEGRRGRVLATVLRYEQGHFPSRGRRRPSWPRPTSPRCKWADGAGRWIA